MTYSSALSLSRGQYAGRNQNVVTFSTTHIRRLGPVSNTILLIVLVCTLGLLYLTQVTNTNAYGYQINALQEQQSQLRTENDNLQLASARLQSLDRVQHSEEAKGMVAVAPSATVTQ